jgi:hypothetical protein
MLADYVYITLWEGAQGEEELQILFLLLLSLSSLQRK